MDPIEELRAENSELKSLVAKLLARVDARRRGIDLLDWLTKALQARRVGASAPPFRAI
jgi:hypothetical protein